MLPDRRRTGRRAPWSSRRVRAGSKAAGPLRVLLMARAANGAGLRKGYRPRAPPLRRSRASATDGRNVSQHLKAVREAPVGNEDSALRDALNEYAHPCIPRQLIDTSQISAWSSAARVIRRASRYLSVRIIQSPRSGALMRVHFFPPASLARSGVIWAIGTMGTGNRLVHG